jgi:hypothetical protein
MDDGRHYFNGENVFVLEVAVEQTVYVSGSVTPNQITSIVMSGFNKGDGGRILFRALLRESHAFDSLVNVEVLDSLSSPFVQGAAPTDDFATAFPSLGPTSTQSDFPSSTALIDILSMQPSVGPAESNLPSPSLIPSIPSMPPSVGPAESNVPSPSPIPSMPPSVRPAEYNITSPSPAPSIQPTERTSFPPFTAPAYVIAPVNAPVFRSQETLSSRDSQPLIMGIIAGGLVTIGVSCFFIFCVWFPFRRNRQRQNGDAQPGTGSAEVNPGIRDAAIPETLHLDDDSRSLANTTVTLGENSSKKPNKSRLSALTSESFDDTSIYTSTLPLTSPDSERFGCSPERNRRIETVEEAIEIGFADDDGRSSSRSSVQSSSWNEVIEGKKIRDETRGTKGFDVFSDDDESSYDFGNSIALSDPSFGPSGEKEREYRPAPSPSSAKTRRTMNLVSQKSTGSSQTDKEKSLSDDNEVLDEHHATREREVSSSKLDNNALLRTVLDNARRSEKKGSSKASLKSAPPRIHDLRPWNNDVNRLYQYRSTGLGDHFRMQGSHQQLPPTTSRSVGTYGKPIESSLYESST